MNLLFFIEQYHLTLNVTELNLPNNINTGVSILDVSFLTESTTNEVFYGQGSNREEAIADLLKKMRTCSHMEIPSLEKGGRRVIPIPEIDSF